MAKAEPTKEPVAPKRNLASDLEAGLAIKARFESLLALPDVIAGALEAEGRAAAAEKAVAGLDQRKALLELEVIGLQEKVTLARADADRLIGEAAQQQQGAQARAQQALREVEATLQATSTRQRQETKALEDAHAARVHEMAQEIAHLEGQLTRLAAQKDALRKQLD
jgi:chromosome segregation ATPase